MAPELLRGAKSAPPSADVFSFGIIAYELLTREHPFGEAPITYGLRANRAAVTRVERAGVSDDLARIVHACLSFDPEERPSAQEVADALREGVQYEARVYA
jgi:serine/threonine protein kinase